MADEPFQVPQPLPAAATTTQSAAAPDAAPKRRISDRPDVMPDVFDSIDRTVNARLATLTFGMSPVALAMQTFDWMAHLAASPGKQYQLAEKAGRKLARFAEYAVRSAFEPQSPPCIEPLPQDHRFDHPGWRRFPYNLLYQSFLMHQQWWHNATTEVRGVSPRSEAAV